MVDLVQVTDEVFTIANLLTGRECDDWISLGESMGFEPASINTEFGPRRLSKIRNNDRVIYDNEVRAIELWRRIASNIPAVVRGWKAVGLNERLRFYRYDVGQTFKWHADGCFRRGADEQSMLTFMVYLNDDFTGGETRFQEGVRVEPKKGMALLFCHWQKHMGDEVRSGRKYVLRSDVMHVRSES